MPSFCPFCPDLGSKIAMVLGLVDWLWEHLKIEEVANKKKNCVKLGKKQKKHGMHFLKIVAMYY